MRQSRKLQYSLRSAAIIVTLFAFAMAIFGRRLSTARRQSFIVTTLQNAGGLADYEGGNDDVPADWKVRMLGKDFFTGIEGVLVHEWNNNVLPNGPDPLIALSSELRTLKRIRIENCKLSDTSLLPLEGHVRLEWLSLSGSNANDEHLTLLQKMPHIRILDLRETEITDACLPILVNLRNLELLLVKKTKVSEEGIRQLNDALPHCKINDPRFK